MKLYEPGNNCTHNGLKLAQGWKKDSTTGTIAARKYDWQPVTTQRMKK
jgi:hypothetical protein